MVVYIIRIPITVTWVLTRTHYIQRVITLLKIGHVTHLTITLSLQVPTTWFNGVKAISCTITTTTPIHLTQIGTITEVNSSLYQ